MAPIEIPDFLKHLPLEERGYPIPFFTPIIDGKPDFRMITAETMQMCFDKRLCAVCGKKIREGFWFVGGPESFNHRASSDAHMHEQCARYALRTCPYLFNEKADRVSPEGRPGAVRLNDEHVVKEKPPVIYLICADQVTYLKQANTAIFRYRMVRAYEFRYVDRKLVDTGQVIRVKRFTRV